MNFGRHTLSGTQKGSHFLLIQVARGDLHCFVQLLIHNDGKRLLLRARNRELVVKPRDNLGFQVYYFALFQVQGVLLQVLLDEFRDLVVDVRSVCLLVSTHLADWCLQSAERSQDKQHLIWCEWLCAQEY